MLRFRLHHCLFGSVASMLLPLVALSILWVHSVTSWPAWTRLEDLELVSTLGFCWDNAQSRRKENLIWFPFTPLWSPAQSFTTSSTHFHMVIRTNVLMELTHGIPIVLAASASPLLGFPVTEKLSRNNHQMWQAQVLSVLTGAQLAGFIEDDKNSEYEVWVAKDQQVLSYLLPSLLRDILSQVSSVETAAAAWAAIVGMFASKSRACVISTCMALSTASKGHPPSTNTSPR